MLSNTQQARFTSRPTDYSAVRFSVVPYVLAVLAGLLISFAVVWSR